MSNVFCIGNGTSRKDFNLEKLRPHGKIYGCNALYRTFTPDVLTAVDHGIMHEIYHSGYCNENETWFRDWNKLPADIFESIVYSGISTEQRDDVKKYEPLIALDGGESGLICYREIAKEILGFLKKDGILAIEIGQHQEQDVIKIFSDNGLAFVTEKRDLANIIRCLMFKNIQ
jgi:hypothetical protein